MSKLLEEFYQEDDGDDSFDDYDDYEDDVYYDDDVYDGKNVTDDKNVQEDTTASAIQLNFVQQKKSKKQNKKNDNKKKKKGGIVGLVKEKRTKDPFVEKVKSQMKDIVQNVSTLKKSTIEKEEDVLDKIQFSTNVIEYDTVATEPISSVEKIKKKSLNIVQKEIKRELEELQETNGLKSSNIDSEKIKANWFNSASVKSIQRNTAYLRQFFDRSTKYTMFMEYKKLNPNAVVNDEVIYEHYLTEQIIRKDIGKEVDPYVVKNSKASHYNIYTRSHFASCSVGNYIVMHGGEFKGSTLKELIVYNTKLHKFEVHQYLNSFLHDNFFELPQIKRHKMCCDNSGNLFIGCGQSSRLHTPYVSYSAGRNIKTNSFFFYVIPKFRSKIISNQKLCAVVAASDTKTAKHSYSMNELGGTIYLFGGISDSCSETDELMIINNAMDQCINMQTSTYSAYRLFKPTVYTKRNNCFHDPNAVWPRKRHGHAANVINGSIFIFGGTSTGEILNDLYAFDTQIKKWREIVIESIPRIPPLVHATLDQINSTKIWIIGGTNTHDVSSGIYELKLNKDNPKWKVVMQMGKSIIRTTFPEIKEPSYYLSGHSTHVHGNFIYLIGGESQSRLERDLDRESNKERLYAIENVQIVGKNYQLVNHLKNQRKNLSLIDIVFVLKRRVEEKEIDKNEEGLEKQEQKDSLKCVYAHKCIIKCRCEKLSEYIDNIDIPQDFGQFANETIKNLRDLQMSDDQFVSKDVTVVPIHEYHYEAFEAFISFLYTGELNLQGRKNVYELRNIAKTFNKHSDIIDSVVSCTKEAYLDYSVVIIEEMEKDYGKLIDNEGVSMDFIDNEFEHNSIDIPEASYDIEETNGGEPIENNNQATKNSILSSTFDVRLVMGEDTFKRAHWVFLTRSKYFQKMLKSGMQESVEGIVQLEHMDTHAMSMVLSYIYTSQINLNSETCVGVLIYSILFGLANLASYCRSFISKQLSVDTVLQVLEISDLYKDTYMRSICLSYIKKYYKTMEPMVRAELEGDEELKSCALHAINQGKKKEKSRQNSKK